MDARVDGRGVTIPAGEPVGAPEGTVIRQTQWGAIREMSGLGLSRKAIARELGLDVKTVRKWLKQE